MPKLPTIDGPSYVSESAPGSRPASAEEYGAGIGRGLSKIGETVDQISEKANEVYQDSRANAVLADTHKKLNDFALELKNGPIDPETGAPQQDGEGNVIPPADPSQHKQLYENKINELREAAESSLAGSGGALRKFSDNFESTANAQLLAIQTDAIGQMHQVSRANNEEAWQNQATAFVDAPGGIARDRIHDQVFSSIDRAVADRIITPQEAYNYKKSFVHETEFGLARKIMDSGKNGPEHLMASIKAGEFNKLPPDQREKLYDMAVSRSYTNLQRENAMLDRAEKLDQRYKRKVYEATGKDMLTLDARPGGLNSQNGLNWVLSHRDQLSEGDFKYALNRATGKEETPSDKHTVNTMVFGIMRGEDPNLEDFAGVSPGSPTVINSHDYMMLKKLKSDFTNTVKGDPQAKFYANKITQSFGADALTRTPKQAAAGAEALQEFIKFNVENPNRTEKQLMEKADEVIRRGSLFGDDEFETSTVKPKFLQGDYSTESLRAAGQATEKAHNEGRMNDAEYAREVYRIKRGFKFVATPAAPVKKK